MQYSTVQYCTVLSLSWRNVSFVLSQASKRDTGVVLEHHLVPRIPITVLYMLQYCTRAPVKSC